MATRWVVAAEVVEDLLGAGEGGLGVDDPVGLAEGLEVTGEGGGVVERGEGVAELEPAGAEGLLEQLKKEPAEQAGEDADGEEEAGAAADPAVAVGSNPPTGNDAVQVGVQLQGLPPGMQDGEEADLGAEVLGGLRRECAGCGRRRGTAGCREGAGSEGRGRR